MDFANPSNLEKVLSELCSRVSFDILISVAGVYGENDIADMDLEEWGLFQSVNATAAFLLSREVLPAMKERGSGHIVHIGSPGTNVGIAHKSAYVASKSALKGFVLSLAKEVAQFGIKAHLISPYLVDSSQAIDWDSSPDERDMLKCSDLVELIFYLLNLPQRVHIDEISIKPLGIVGR